MVQQKELEDVELATGIIFNKDGLLFDAAVMPYLSFPNCVHWDWMHNWCSSGGIGQYHLNRFVHEITDIVDLSKNFRVGIPLDKLLQLAIDYPNTLNVARVVVDLLKFRVEPIALFIVAAGEFGL